RRPRSGSNHVSRSLRRIGSFPRITQPPRCGDVLRGGTAASANHSSAHREPSFREVCVSFGRNLRIDLPRAWVISKVRSVCVDGNGDGGGIEEDLERGLNGIGRLAVCPEEEGLVG